MRVRINRASQLLHKTLFYSRVAQRKRAGPITQRSMDRNHPLLRDFNFYVCLSPPKRGNVHIVGVKT